MTRILCGNCWHDKSHHVHWSENIIGACALSYNGGQGQCPCQKFAPTQPLKHEHEWQPAGIAQINPVESVIIMGMCKCGEIMMRQWDT